MQRYFAVDNKLNISNGDKHHIINVMRMRQDDKIEIVSDNKIFLCNIDKITKDDVYYSVVRELDINNELDKKVTIALPLLMEKKIDFILQKCTELGAYEFIFYNAKRSKIKIAEKINKKLDRWNLITKEASEQSFRNICPKVKGILDLKELVSIPYDLKIVCSTKENKKTVKNILQNSTNCDRIIIVVGPEGGLEESEEEFLCKNDFCSTSLGSTILRAETAPMFIMSAIKYEFMR